MKRKMRISKKVISDYDKLISELSLINGSIYHHNSIVEIYLEEIDKRNKIIKRDVFLGSRFSYRSPFDGKLLFGEIYKTGSKDFRKKSKTILRKVTNYYVAIAYEAFERFLRSITARIIVSNQKKAKGVDAVLGFSSYNSCLIFLQSQYKNNEKIIALLRKLSEDLNSSIEKEKGLRNFLNFYRVYSKCRNHIIHSNDLVSADTIKKPQAVDEKFAKRYFGTTLNCRTKKLVIDTTHTYEEALETIAKFAYFIIISFDSSFIK